MTVILDFEIRHFTIMAQGLRDSPMACPPIEFIKLLLKLGCLKPAVRQRQPAMFVVISPRVLALRRHCAAQSLAMLYFCMGIALQVRDAGRGGRRAAKRGR